MVPDWARSIPPISSTSYTVVSRNKRRMRPALSGFRIFITRPNGVQEVCFPCFPRSRSTTPKKTSLSHTVRKRKNGGMGGNFNTHGMDFLFPATELVYLSKFDTNSHSCQNILFFTLH